MPAAAGGAVEGLVAIDPGQQFLDQRVLGGPPGLSHLLGMA